MTVLAEGPHAGGHIVSEANGWRSREKVTIAQGEVLPAGTVLGKLTVGGQYVAYDNAGTDGRQTAVGILFDAVDATAAAVEAVAHVRDCEVNQAELNWEDNDTTGINAGISDLLSLGIIMR